MTTEAKLAKDLETLGLRSASELAEKLFRFARLVLSENQKTNLVGPMQLDELIVAHVLDSLAPLAGERLLGPVVDLGSGAGFPGIPAALAYPALAFVLLEPRTKRAEFLRMAIAELQIGNADVVRQSAFTYAAGEGSGTAGTVLVRAVAVPMRALELALPMLREGGKAVLYLGRRSEPTGAERRSAAKMGATLTRSRRVSVPGLQAERHVWWFRKVAQA